MLPLAILAGGLAKRLRPITETIPKAMVDVAGRPFISWQLEYLKNQGISKVVICSGYLGEQIEDYVGDGTRFGLNISYSHDGPKLLGTGGAIRRVSKFFDGAFFVMYGDSFLPVEFAPVQRHFFENQRKALMTVLLNENRWDKSNVLYSDGKLKEYNKHAPRSEMSYIDYGLSILTSGAFENTSDGLVFDLSDLFHKLSLMDQLIGFKVTQRFYEIGSHRGLEETTSFLERYKI